MMLRCKDIKSYSAIFAQPSTVTRRLAVPSQPAITTAAAAVVRAFHAANPHLNKPKGEIARSKAMDSRVGTVAAHRHHLVVCNSSSKEWPSKVEGMSPAITALAQGAIRLPGRAMVTLSDFTPFNHSSNNSCASSSTQGSATQDTANKYNRIDVAVFPLGIVARQLDKDGIKKLIEWLGHDILPTSWSPSHANLPRPSFDHSWLELSRNRHIFVCTHGSRDYLCGLHGGKLLEDLRALISERNMGKHVAAWSTSHIGGHKFAANAIVYPRGDWYGTWCDRCGSNMASEDGVSINKQADAEAIIEAATCDVIWWDAWRGAINMSKKDQIATWSNNNQVESTSSGNNNQQSADADTFTSWAPKSSRRSSVIGS